LVKIGAALVSDQDALIDIWLRCVRSPHRFLTEEDIQSLLPAVVEYFAHPEPELWVLCAGSDRPAGFMGLSTPTVDRSV
jgi:putative acetyltransferase